MRHAADEARARLVEACPRGVTGGLRWFCGREADPSTHCVSPVDLAAVTGPGCSAVVRTTRQRGRGIR